MVIADIVVDAAGGGGGHGCRCQRVRGVTWRVHDVAGGGGGHGRRQRHVWACMVCSRGGPGGVGRIRTGWGEGGWGLGQPNSDAEKGGAAYLSPCTDQEGVG